MLIFTLEKRGDIQFILKDLFKLCVRWFLVTTINPKVSKTSERTSRTRRTVTRRAILPVPGTLFEKDCSGVYLPRKIERG